MRLDHVGVHVADLERSIAFYRDVFNLRVAARFSIGAEELVFLSAEDRSGFVELVWDGRPARPTGVVDHLALRVADLDQLLSALKAYGVKLLDEAPIDVPEIGARIAFCLGPDEERIELIQR